MITQKIAYMDKTTQIWSRSLLSKMCFPLFPGRYRMCLKFFLGQVRSMVTKLELEQLDRILWLL